MLKNPSHPGEIIRDETLPSFGLSVSGAARVLNADRASLHKVLSAQAAVSPAMALKMERAFGVSADLLLNLQTQWDLAQARKRADEITAGVVRQSLVSAGG